MPDPADLDWHYGPTADNPDPGRMWHRGCGGEVMFIEDRHVCMRCDRNDGPDPADLTAFLEAQWDDEQRAEEGKTSWTPPPGGVRCPHCRMPVEEITSGGPVRYLTLGPCGDEVTRAEWEAMVIVKPAGDQRKLADIASKRAILALHQPVQFTDVTLGIVDAVVCFTCHVHLDEPDGWADDGGDEWSYPLVQEAWPCKTVRALAQPFRGAPGWRNEWAIED